MPRGSVGPGYRGYYRGGYYGGYYPRYSFGFYGGYPYYSPYYYPWGYWGYGYPYAYGYGYGYPYGYYGGYYYDTESRAARGLGSIRIKGAPEHAQVFADGYYAGIVDDFDGTFQHLDLTAGPHHIEIRPQGQPPISFDVNVELGETVTYHAR